MSEINMKTGKSKLLNNQDGVVSLIVTIFIILLLSLIVLAMSQNARNEQRQSLDRELSNQAFYNAESGVNDVSNYLYNHRSDTTVPNEKLDTCDTSFLGVGANQISAVNKYTCIFYTKIPITLDVSNLPTNDSRTLNIEMVSQAGVPGTTSELTFSWQGKGGNDFSGCDFGGGTKLPTELPANCEIGGLRIDITPILPSRAEINEKNLNLFLLPKGATGATDLPSIPAYPDNQGIIREVHCTTTPPPDQYRCDFTVKGLNVPRAVVHMRSLYSPVDVTIAGKIADGAGGTVSGKFNNSQIMVDSTGKASDVLRRIQVRLPIYPENRTGDFALQSKGTICKLFDVDEITGTASSHPDCPVPAP